MPLLAAAPVVAAAVAGGLVIVGVIYIGKEAYYLYAKDDNKDGKPDVKVEKEDGEKDQESPAQNGNGDSQTGDCQGDGCDKEFTGKNFEGIRYEQLFPFVHPALIELLLKHPFLPLGQGFV